MSPLPSPTPVSQPLLFQRLRWHLLRNAARVVLLAAPVRLTSMILIDSRQLESGESMSGDFKKLAAHQIEDFKAEYRRRFPGRDTENLTDEDLMREVLNIDGSNLHKTKQEIRKLLKGGAA